jgi:hypothetical protein
MYKIELYAYAAKRGPYRGQPDAGPAPTGLPGDGEDDRQDNADAIRADPRRFARIRE